MSINEVNKKNMDEMNLFDKLVGTEGMKIDVTANLSPEIYIKLFITIVGAVVVSAIGINLLSSVLTK